MEKVSVPLKSAESPAMGSSESFGIGGSSSRRISNIGNNAGGPNGRVEKGPSTSSAYPSSPAAAKANQNSTVTGNNTLTSSLESDNGTTASVGSLRNSNSHNNNNNSSSLAISLIRSGGSLTGQGTANGGSGGSDSAAAAVSTSGSNNVQKSANFLSQLEVMMGAVKKEASALESMKVKLREMEELRSKYSTLKVKYTDLDAENMKLRKSLRDSEQLTQELRTDMQQLNDFYTAERNKQLEMQSTISRLEQELSGVKVEKEFFVKESQKYADLKKTAKGLKSQLQQTKAAADEAKSRFQTKIKDLEVQTQGLEAGKKEATEHFWNVSEELKGVRKELSESLAFHKTLRDEVVDEAKKAQVYIDRLQMLSEDLQQSNQRRVTTQRQAIADYTTISATLQTLERALRQREAEADDLATRLHESEKQLETTNANQMARITILESENGKFRSQHNEMSKELSSWKKKIGDLGSSRKVLDQELSKLREKMQETERIGEMKEGEHAMAVKALTQQRDDALFQVQSLTAQCEGVQAQAKSDQARLLEESHQLKNNEALLLEEAEKLTQELQEKTVLLHALEAEKRNAEVNMRDEVSGKSQMVSSLRSELERRLDDLVQLRKDRDACKEENEKLMRSVEELQTERKKKEELFKKTLEADRNKVKQELTARMNRVKALENEKQELLNETHELMMQVERSAREAAASKAEAEEHRDNLHKIREQMESTSTRNTEIANELKNATLSAQEYKQKAQKHEEKLREDLKKLDVQMKEAKKSSGQQIVDLNIQIKTLYDEIEDLKSQMHKKQDNEERLTQDLERAKRENEGHMQSSSDIQSQLNADLQSLRKEAQDQRSKAKVIQESKTQLEMELINVRMECTRGEAEIQRQNEAMKALESSTKGYLEQIKSLQQDLATLNDLSHKSKAKVSELEAALQRKNETIDDLNKDIEHVEQESLVEVRRLRLQINNADQELNELRPMLQMVQKELGDAKATIAKHQSTNNSTVNNLLEELRSTEDALSKERKKALQEGEKSHEQISALQLQLEKAKESIEELETRGKTDKSDKDIRIMQLEHEVDRVKSSVTSRDARIDELEKQHQLNRAKLLELKDKLDSAERETQEAQSALEVEQAQRKRADGRLKTLTLQLEGGGQQGLGNSHNNSSSNLYGHNAGMGRTGGGSGGNGSNGDKFLDLKGIASGNDAFLTSRTNYSSAGNGGSGQGGAGTMSVGSSARDPLTGRSERPFSSRRRHQQQQQQQQQVSFHAQGQHNMFELPSGGHMSGELGAAAPHSASSMRSPVGTPKGGARGGGGFGLSTSGEGHAMLLQNPADVVSTPTAAQRQHQQQQQQSPVVDRVSAALAARAAAESSKNALKQAQMLARNARHSSNSSTSAASSAAAPTATFAASSPDNLGDECDPLSASSRTNPRSQQQQKQQKQGYSYQSQQMHQSSIADSVDYNYDDMSLSVAGEDTERSAGGVEAAEERGLSSVEESILRAQRMIDKKKRGYSGGAAAGLAAAGGGSGGVNQFNPGSLDTSNHGVSVTGGAEADLAGNMPKKYSPRAATNARMSENIQLANMLYPGGTYSNPNSPARDANGNAYERSTQLLLQQQQGQGQSTESRAGSSQSQNGGSSGYYLSTPLPKPASPPYLSSGGGSSSGSGIIARAGKMAVSMEDSDLHALQKQQQQQQQSQGYDAFHDFDSHAVAHDSSSSAELLAAAMTAGADLAASTSSFGGGGAGGSKQRLKSAGGKGKRKSNNGGSSNCSTGATGSAAGAVGGSSMTGSASSGALGQQQQHQQLPKISRNSSAAAAAYVYK